MAYRSYSKVSLRLKTPIHGASGGIAQLTVKSLSRHVAAFNQGISSQTPL
jgi:hypothetical protein